MNLDLGITINVTFNVVVMVNDRWPVGVEDDKLNLVSMYTNPFYDNLTFDNINNVTQIMISNILRQAVLITVPVTDNRMVINTENLKKGIYLITIQEKYGNTRTKKVVKQ